jgi:hypothetical protein
MKQSILLLNFADSYFFGGLVRYAYYWPGSCEGNVINKIFRTVIARVVSCGYETWSWYYVKNIDWDEKSL